MGKYETSFIPQNKAPKNNNYIYVYNGTTLAGKIKTGAVKMPTLGNKLYSFGALADVHIQRATGTTDFQRALTYFNEVEKVSFTCIAGDLGVNGTDAEFIQYAQFVGSYSPNTPVYECTGNHDVETTRAAADGLKTYTGHSLYYTFAHGDDVFIFFGMSGWPSKTGTIFEQSALQWLYEMLEANRNKRCFVFEHCPRFDGSGLPYPDATEPTGNLLSYPEGLVFQSLMEHYKNVIWFHGHTHSKFHCQADCAYANYDRMFGCHSVHIPSGQSTKYYNGSWVTEDENSEGYVVDVYKNHIVLRGRDFANERFLPIATYCIDTTLQTVEAGTFADSTGTIST